MRPSLFTAIREQLGLRLEVRRTPVDVIMIDRLLLTPTPNETRTELEPEPNMNTNQEARTRKSERLRSL